jgi:hypothetical protein
MNKQERAEPSGRGSEQSDEFLLNRAYRCFAFLGIVTIPFPLLDLLTQVKAANGIVERWGGLAELAGMILALPTFAGMLYATVCGIRLTVRFRHRPLVFLSAVSIICGGGFMLSIPYWDSPGSAVMGYLMSLGFGVYMAANILIPAWWLIKGREHYRRKVALQD